MAKAGPILIFEDDPDDQEVLQECLNALNVKNELKFFNDCAAALHYLKTTTDRPFLILSDVNMPGMTGNDLKKEINKDKKLRQKSIPFVFLTTSIQDQSVSEAYELMVQGYFQKENSISQIKQTLKMIVDYWSICKHPEAI
jgi:CheY-like chemotaxis protein